MTYRVIKYFTDLQDNGYAYNVGDTFPHEGKQVKPSRIAELASDKNRRKIPLIELVKDSKDAPVTDDNTDAKANEAETVAEKPKKATTKRKAKSE